jgi:autotransporter strand-loop-strand O-heptosyltransferase
MKITVVVRTYNREEFLKEALTSIQLQTHTDWEVLIFDDANSTSNFEIYQNFKKQNLDKRVVYLTTSTPYDLFKNSWLHSPKLAEGELIVRLDDDDLLVDDAFEFISNTYTIHSDLDFSYGSSILFKGNTLESVFQSQTPIEAPKTKDIWEGYLHGHPHNNPWRFKHDYYEEPQNHTSIIHCSKANIMCVYHTYVMRVSSVLKVLDKITMTSNFVDDLEFLGSLDNLGLKHTSIKRILSYVRVHDQGRVTDKEKSVDGITLWDDILRIRDKVDFLRPNKFQSNLLTNDIDGNFNEGVITSKHQSHFTQYKRKIEILTGKIIDDQVKNNPLRVLFLAPHLSTGGMPSYLLKRIESLIQYTSDVEIFVAEFCEYSNLYTVQRNRIKELIPEQRFWTINTLSNHTVENSMKVIDIIKSNSIDIVHVDEMIEGFDSFNKVPNELKNALYNNDRTWRVVETCHNIWFDPNTSKQFHPDAYALCTPYHLENTFKETPSHKEVFEFPIENKFRSREEQIKSQEILGLDSTKIHIINVGLWTSGKNQGEGIEIARHFQDRNVEFHFVGNQASNFESYWGPLMSNLPSNVRVWGERNDVETFMKASDILMFNSTWECNPLVIREAASLGLKIIARDLPQYVGMFKGLITPFSDEISTNVSLLRKLISSTRDYQILNGMTENFTEKHYNLYKFLLTQEPIKNFKNNSKVHVKQFFINEPFLEITGESDSEYNVKFFDEFGICHYDNKIKSNHWIKLSRKYFTKWNTKILEDGILIYDKTLDYKGKRVFINFDSRSLGDTISWIPYVLEFKNVHQCDVIVSTYLNHLFRDVYPELEFVEPGNVVHNIHGQYNIGWFYDVNKEPVLPNTIPLQQAATNILGLPYTEIKPRISYKIYDRPYKEKYITIATNSTAGCKFWTKEGWQELINYLHSLGYKVINVSKEDNKFNNCEKVKNTAMDYTMNVIHHSEFFIGLSSGLSWLSWAMGKHVVMISNFTESDHEFTSNCTRITNPNVCNGCWNNPIHRFDKGDWNWCPVHKGTSRQFECHTTITSEMVINQIKHLLM